MRYQAMMVGLFTVCLLGACVSYDHLPANVRVVEFIVPGCE